MTTPLQKPLTLVTIPFPGSPKTIAERVAHLVFEERGERAEINIAEPDLAGVIEAAIQLYKRLNPR